ncbi:hypothetical protein [Nocardia fusca]|uniref:Uncharacterized protein n=1 Tax=Nocardia fusca TaxID=941183 RepID=A0ABV3F8D6_9NOCA
MDSKREKAMRSDYTRYADLIAQARRTPAGSDTETALLEQAHAIRSPWVSNHQGSGHEWSYLDTATGAAKAGRDIDADLKFFHGTDPAEPTPIQQRHRAQAQWIAERHQHNTERPQRGIQRSR